MVLAPADGAWLQAVLLAFELEFAGDALAVQYHLNPLFELLVRLAKVWNERLSEDQQGDGDGFREPISD